MQRFKDLAKSEVIDIRVYDEEMDRFEAAQSRKDAAIFAVETAKFDVKSKEAILEQVMGHVATAKANVNVAKAKLGKAETYVSFTRMLAPFAGVITKRNYNNGDLIRAGDHGRPLPLFVVQRMDRMRIILQVPEKSASLVQVGMQVELTMPNLPGTLSGKIARTAQAIEEGSLRVEMEVANPRNLLLPGMTGKAAIHLEKSK